MIRKNSTKLKYCISVFFLALLMAIPISLARGSIEVRAGTVLKTDMQDFITVDAGNGSTYEMAQMSGLYLTVAHHISGLDPDHQYFVWIQTDKEATSNDTWYTQKIILHQFRVNYDVSQIESNNLGEFNTTAGYTKVGDSEYYKSGKQGGLPAGNGETRTMFFYDTTYLEQKAEKNSNMIDKNTQQYTFYMSPVIGHRINQQDQGASWTNVTAWYTGGLRDGTCYWDDKDLSHYQAHYNIEITLEMDTVELVTRWRVMGHQVEDSSKTIAKTEDLEVREDIIEDFRRTSSIPRNPDNQNGEVGYIEIAEKSHVSPKSVTTANNKKKYVCTGYKFYYIDPNTKKKHYLLYDTLGVDNFEEETKKLKVLAYKDYEVYIDRRLDTQGKENNAWQGENYTYQEFSSNMNTFKKLNFFFNKKIGKIPKDVDKVYLDWLYTSVTDITATIQKYYVKGGIEQRTPYDIDLKSVDSALNYSNSTKSKNCKKIGSPYVESIRKGDPWFSYQVETEEGSSEPLRTDPNDPLSVTPILDNGQKISKIPYTTKNDNAGSDSETDTCYLFKVLIETDYPEDWEKLTASDIWKKRLTNKGSIGGSGGTFTAKTSAPYMAQYTQEGSSGNIIFKNYVHNWNRAWVIDIERITQFAIENVRHDFTIKCYYTSTVPVQIVVYSGNSDGSYELAKVDDTRYWISEGKKFSKNASSYADGKIAGVYMISDRNTKLTPYYKKNSYVSSYDSISDIYSTTGKAHQLQLDGSEFTTKIGYYPTIIAIFVNKGNGWVPPPSEGEPGKAGYTLVRYVHTSDGKYIKRDDSFYEIKDNVKEDPHEIEETVPATPGVPEHKEKKPEHAKYVAWTARAYVSFQEYDEYDEGNQGLNGSIYQLSNIIYNYEGPGNDRPVTTFTEPTGEHDGNNNEYYYLQEHAQKMYKGGSSLKECDQDVSIGNRNSLVVYAIYEDVFGGFSNTITNDFTETKVDYWNWELPEGFAWGGGGLDPIANLSDYTARVFGTNESAVFRAQEAIPSSEYVRATSQVARYQTRGYWIQHDLRTIYKALCIKANNSRVKQTFVTGEKQVEECPDSKIENEFYVYTDGGLEQKEVTLERTATYWTLGDAEVFEPDRVTLENDVFADSACSSDHLITLYPKENSNAMFIVTKAPANFAMPPLNRNKLIVSYGIQNSWAGGSTSNMSDAQKRAEDLVGNFSVCNDEVAFFDGLGNRHVLTTSTTGLVPSVKRPKRVPEATLTAGGIFDSKNHRG